jgi:hypothetical protein
LTPTNWITGIIATHDRQFPDRFLSTESGEKENGSP